MRLITAPEPLALQPDEGTIFLGGTIDQGQASNWQDEVIATLNDLDVTILNPRRAEWNPEWPQDAGFAPFREQVEWELAALARANLIVLYFEPDSKSPITLLELGLYATSRKLMVCCPAGYWRKGNVDIVCSRYGIRECSTFAALTIHLRHHIEQRLLSPR